MRRRTRSAAQPTVDPFALPGAIPMAERAVAAVATDDDDDNNITLEPLACGSAKTHIKVVLACACL